MIALKRELLTLPLFTETFPESNSVPLRKEFVSFCHKIKYFVFRYLHFQTINKQINITISKIEVPKRVLSIPRYAPEGVLQILEWRINEVESTHF